MLSRPIVAQSHPTVPHHVPSSPPRSAGPHCAPLCPIVPCCAHLDPVVPHCAMLGRTAPRRAPPCPTMSCCALLCPVISPCALLFPTASLHPAMPHCIPLCPTASCHALLFPSVAPLCTIPHHCAPLCPTVPHAPPTHGALSPLRPRHSSHSPAAILPPRSGGTGPGWQGFVPSIPFTPPPRRGPPPCHPAVTVTQALAVLPEKMEAAALLRLWALAGEWQPQHQRGDKAGGTPIWRGGGGTLRGGGCQWESWVNPSSPWGWGFGDKGTEGTEGIPVFGGSRVRGRGCPYPCPRPHSCPPPQHLLNIAGTVGTRVLGAAMCAAGLLEMGKLRQGGAVPLLWLQPCS